MNSSLRNIIKISNIIFCVFNFIVLIFLCYITFRIIGLEKTQIDNYVRIERQISEVNKKVNYAGG